MRREPALAHSVWLSWPSTVPGCSSDQAFLANGFRLSCASNRRPSALGSVLCGVRTGAAIDLVVSERLNERTAALAHLAQCRPDDILVFDRGATFFRTRSPEVLDAVGKRVAVSEHADAALRRHC